MTELGDFRWRYDEFQQVGTDYGSHEEVDIYDSRHSTFRDLNAEARKVLDCLDLGPGASVIDFGPGTGIFALHAARQCAQVYAVDVSQTMLDRASARAAREGVSNIAFHHAGFLTYEHTAQPVDAIVTTFAFHHLPDFWKGIALKRLHGMLKPGGQLYIHDVILEENGALEQIQGFIDELDRLGGARLKEDTERHFRDEYSTYDWVMDELLRRAAFTVKSKQMENGVLGTYQCVRA